MSNNRGDQILPPYAAKKQSRALFAHGFNNYFLIVVVIVGVGLVSVLFPFTP